MAQEKLLPLALLYVDSGREIEGATRFQKLVFLAQEERGLGDIFDFESYKYGPFSPELHATLDELENRGLLEKKIETNRSGNETYSYHLTGVGRRVVQNLMDNDNSGTFDKLLDESNEVKREHNDKTLDRLLRYVYSKYPDYTDKSELEEIVPS